ncbi:2-amino-5-chloromuconate deaminase CnbZ [Aureimonas populi]|uniref:RidA family protein n=1 Tax=Aureimonas populi TaxID=1701758 RepID=A0ABW5CK34_9HYPH|nr:hypothetical protein [Aureimonas populi]
MSGVEITAGGYRTLPLVMQFSAGVAALPGFAVERARFEHPVPLAQGFARIEAHLKAIGRPLTAFCACELRSPEPFTEASFAAFNLVYTGTLREWGVMADGMNPVARSNVCPEIGPPGEPSFHAVSYTVEAPGAGPSFVVAGSCEVPENQPGEYASHIVRHGETSPEAIAEKARFVLGELERRMGLLGASWAQVTGTQAYTVHDLGPFLAQEIVARGAAPHGLTWHYNRPPVLGLEFEMDCRRVLLERVLEA